MEESSADNMNPHVLTLLFYFIQKAANAGNVFSAEFFLAQGMEDHLIRTVPESVFDQIIYQLTANLFRARDGHVNMGAFGIVSFADKAVVCHALHLFQDGCVTDGASGRYVVVNITDSGLRA